MNIDHLILFVNLAETLNFTQTAKNKHVTQSAVSQSISSIERELGINLFIRNQQGVQITKNGSLFYQQMKPMLNTYNKAVQLVRQESNREKSNLSIGTTGSPFEEQVLPQMISGYSKASPATKIYVEYLDHQQVKDHLLHQDDNLIFATQDDISNIETIHYTPLLSGHFCALVPNTNPLVHQACLSVTDLENQSLIFLDSNWAPPEQWKVQEVINRTDHDLDVSYVNNITAANTMAKSGIGLAIMPDFVAYPDPAFVKAIPLDYDVHLIYGIATLRGNEAKEVTHFIQWVKQSRLFVKTTQSQ